MRRRIAGTLTLLVLLPALLAFADAQDKPKPDTPKSPAELYKALTDEFQKAQQEFFKAYQEAKTDEEKNKIYQEKYPKPQDHAKKFLDLAQKHPKDPAAIDALIWIVQSAGYTPEAGQALTVIADQHLANPKIGKVCQNLAYSQSPVAEKVLRAVREKNPNKEAKGQATLALALYLKQRAEGKDDKKSPEIEKLLEEVVAKYADINPGRGSLADTAKGELFEMRNLAIGKVAPEVAGEDADSKKFKLSDYRGKVVVLDFWASW